MEREDYNRILNIMDPPETIEISAELRLGKSVTSCLKLSDLQREINKSICHEIAKQLIEKDLVEIKQQDSQLGEFIIITGKLKVTEYRYKLKSLI